MWEWRRGARAWRAVRGRHGGIRLGRTSSAACQRSSRGEKHGCSHSASRSGSFSCSPRTSLGWQRAGARLPCLRAPRTLYCSGRRCWRPGSGSRRRGEMERDWRARRGGGRESMGAGVHSGRYSSRAVVRGGRVANEERVTNAKTNISPRHYFPALLSHLSRGLLPRPLFAPRGRPRGSTSTERQKPFSPPVFHPCHSPPPHTPLLLLRAIATRFNCHRRAKIPTGWICVPCPVPTRLLPTQMPPGRRPCRFFFDYGCIQLKKNALICVRMQNLNGIMLGAPFYVPTPKPR